MKEPPICFFRGGGEGEKLKKVPKYKLHHLNGCNNPDNNLIIRRNFTQKKYFNIFSNFKERYDDKTKYCKRYEKPNPLRKQTTNEMLHDLFFDFNLENIH